MAILTPQQRKIAIDAIIQMEGADKSEAPYSPTTPAYGAKASILIYGDFQNDFSKNESKLEKCGWTGK